MTMNKDDRFGLMHLHWTSQMCAMVPLTVVYLHNHHHKSFVEFNNTKKNIIITYLCRCLLALNDFIQMKMTHETEFQNRVTCFIMHASCINMTHYTGNMNDEKIVQL